MRNLRIPGCPGSGPIAVLLLPLALYGCGGSSGGGGGGGNGGGDPPPDPPTISVATPAAASLNRTVTLTADVTAPAGLTLVEFLVDGTVVGEVTEEPFEAEWDTSTVEDGEHVVTGRVTDAEDTTVTSDEVAVSVDNQPTIAVALTPAEVWPLPDSEASGSGELTFDLVSGAVTGSVSVTGMTATAAHIHQQFAAADGPVVVPFEPGAEPDTWQPEADGMLTAELVDALLAGQLYLNVHSDAFPAGEIRAQIRPANIQVVFTDLTGDAVVPPVTTDAVGRAAATLDTNASTATVHLNTAGVEDATEAHVHVAAADESSADVLLALVQDGADPNHWAVEREAVTTEQIGQFDANTWYVDVHTPGNPDGELRGQLLATEEEPPPPEEEVTLSQLQESIFSPRCAVCHSGTGAELPESMNLTSVAESGAALVGVASTQQPAVLRVAPGDPENSYLIHKLEGRAGIEGVRMPFGGPFLSDAEIDQVRAWITAGAPTASNGEPGPYQPD